MTYAVVWDSTRPVGTTAAKQIDDEIRLVRSQLEERLEDVLITDITADPWVLKDEVIGKTDDLVKLIPFSAFTTPIPDRDIDVSGVDNFSLVNDRNASVAPIDIPVGCVITQVDFRAQRSFATSMQFKLMKQSFESGTGTETTVATSGSSTLSTSAISVVSLEDLNETVDSNSYYWLSVKGFGGTNSISGRVYGVKITFNRPSIASAT